MIPLKRSLFAIATLVLLHIEFAVTMVMAQQPSGNDLRDIRIGMAVTDLPAAGYVNLTCAGDEGRGIAAWSGWHKLPGKPGGADAPCLRFGPRDEPRRNDGCRTSGDPDVAGR